MASPRIVYSIRSVARLFVLAVWKLDAAVIMWDDFECTTGLITSDRYYDYAPFPERGTSTPDNPSELYEMGTGFVTNQNGWLFFGTPREVGTEYYMRFNLRRFDLGDIEVTWRYRSSPFGVDGYSVSPPHAASLWLRKQTQFDLYAVQFDRTDNEVVVKRKVPGLNWTGPGTPSNYGNYYELKTDGESPAGAGKMRVAWSSVGLPNPAHDTNTVYHFKARVANAGDGSVQIKLWRDGTLVASWIDRSDGVYFNGESLAQHLAEGNYDSVPGWRDEWGLPLTRPGTVGFRADNIKLWIDDIEIRTLQNSDSKVQIKVQDGKVVIEWLGKVLQRSTDLRNWEDIRCEKSPMTVIWADRMFYRTRDQ